MKITKYLLMATGMVLGLGSCADEGFSTATSRQGSTSLSVDKVMPVATRAVETADYPVAIYSEEGEEILSYDRADLVPDRIQLPVGRYYAEAHTPGTLEKKMESPYYMGRDEFEILQNVNTVSTISCRMANGSIMVSHTEEFKKVFSNCVVTVDDGTQSALIYNASAETNFQPITHYLLFEENTKALYVNIVATTKADNYRSTMNFTLTKKEATERYDDDVEYFKGGDCIVIHCDTTKVDTSEGSITGITIKADIQFTESEEDVIVDVEDFIPEDEDIPGEGDTPAESDAITLDLPEDMVVSAATDPALGNTFITAEHGIKSIMVKMTSTSDAMMGSLADLAEQWEVDFISGAEVVENTKMERLFVEGLQQSLTVPSAGDTEYTFPIGNFFSLLAFLPGEHTFTLTVTDMQDGVKNGQLTLTVE